MLSLNNLRISNKILISPFIVMLFLILLSMFSINTLKHGQSNFKNIVEEKVELLNIGNKFLIDISEYNILVYRVFNFVTNVYEEAEINEQIELIAKIKKTLANDLKVLKSLGKSNLEIKKNILEVEKNIKAYNLAIDDTMNDVMNITFDRLLEAEVYFEKIEEELNKINANTKKKNKEIYQDEIKEIDFTLNVMYLSIIIALTLSILITFLVTKSIKKPLSIFESGLLEFFKYLNQETKDVKQIDIHSKDELGKMAEIINLNIQKTEEKIEEDRALLDNTIKCANEAKKGFLNVKIDGETSNPMLNELKNVINDMLHEVEQNIKKSINVLSSYTKYDYTARVDISNIQGDLNALSSDINSLGDAICFMLKENNDIGLFLAKNASSLSLNVENLNEAANNQAASLEETSAAIEEITSSMKNSSENISKMNSYANEVSSSVQVGQSLASKTVNSMDEINEQTNSIADAITVIDQIAFQTNILSLNAAVEAATAGEAGKGFAVVAQEVRNLASRSADAAREIKELVEKATSKTNEGKLISSEMIDGYEKLNSNIHNTLSLIDEISESSSEQFKSMEQINDEINKLDHVTQQNAVATEEANKVASEVNKIAEKVVANTNDKEFIDKD